MAERVRRGGPSRYYKAKNVVFLAPTPVIDWLDELAHEMRSSRSEVVLYLLDRGARASKWVDKAEWQAVVAASRHTSSRANSDDPPTGDAKHLTDLD